MSSPRTPGTAYGRLGSLPAGKTLSVHRFEVPRGPVVESLMERGFEVHSINPKQLDRFQDRISAVRREGRPAGRSGAGLGAADRRALSPASGTDRPDDRRVAGVVAVERGPDAGAGSSGEPDAGAVVALLSAVPQGGRRRRGGAVGAGPVAEPADAAGWPAGSGGDADPRVEAAPHPPARRGGAARAAAGAGRQADAGCGRSGHDACAACGRTARPGQPSARPCARPARRDGASARRGGAGDRDGLVGRHRVGPVGRGDPVVDTRHRRGRARHAALGRQRCVAASGLRGAALSVRGGLRSPSARARACSWSVVWRRTAGCARRSSTGLAGGLGSTRSAAASIRRYAPAGMVTRGRCARWPTGCSTSPVRCCATAPVSTRNASGSRPHEAAPAGGAVRNPSRVPTVGSPQPARSTHPSGTDGTEDLTSWRSPYKTGRMRPERPGAAGVTEEHLLGQQTVRFAGVAPGFSLTLCPAPCMGRTCTV